MEEREEVANWLNPCLAKPWPHSTVASWKNFKSPFLFFPFSIPKSEENVRFSTENQKTRAVHSRAIWVPIHYEGKVSRIHHPCCDKWIMGFQQQDHPLMKDYHWSEWRIYRQLSAYEDAFFSTESASQDQEKTLISFHGRCKYIATVIHNHQVSLIYAQITHLFMGIN